MLLPKIVTTTITPARHIEIEKNKEMSDAVSALFEDGDYINVAEGLVNKVEKDTVPAGVYFKILTKVKGRVTEYKNLVYSKGQD